MRASLKSSSRRPGRLLVLFALVTLLPAAGLIWLGTALIRQDRDLADKQLRDRLERDVDAVAADLLRDVTPPKLPAPPASSGHAAAHVVPASLWTAAEDAEQQGRTDAAVAAYQRLVGSAEPAVRAGAMIRLARTLRRAGRVDEALDIYGRMSGMDDVRVFDEPASLLAALGRVSELDARGRDEERDRDAAAIRRDLASGRWRVEPAMFEAAWIQVSPPRMFAAAWRGDWRRRNVVVVLISDADGRPVIEAAPLGGPTVRRAPNESRLPWTIQMSSASPDSERAAFATRRRQLILVLSLAAFLVLAGAYFVARGIRRELAAAELQSSFVSAVSHEFRTPLTSMSHLIELLRERANMDEPRRAKYYDALEQEASRLRRFVDQLLDFGRVQAGVAQYDLAPADPVTLVDDVVERFRTGPAAQGRAVTCRAGSGLPSVNVDHESFALALNNLLENAAKYSAGDTPIEVAVDPDAASGRLAVHVRDHGAGIPRSEHAVIFEKFVRGAGARASSVRGTGVGLALAREIIRAHGGDISVQSEPGKGSTFTILLPAAS